MPAIKPDVYQMDRRNLLKLTGAMGIGATFVAPSDLLAAGVCEKVDVHPPTGKTEQAGATLQFWIDGLHFDASSKSDLKSRANITLFMDLMQSAAIYVESVVLLDPQNAVLGARYFDSSMKMLDKNHVPYVRFENVELDREATYTVIYSVRTGSNVKLYTSLLVKPKISALNTTFLPQQMRTDFKSFITGNLASNATPGLVTTPFQFYTANHLDLHCARGRILDMASDGSSFTVNIEYMHADLAFDHYMRYFIVMDPVGRILGFHKRTWDATLNKGDASKDGTPFNGKRTLNVTAITEAQRMDFNIPELQIGNIADCPYIQFYTEDSYDAIARNMIRLR